MYSQILIYLAYFLNLYCILTIFKPLNYKIINFLQFYSNSFLDNLF